MILPKPAKLAREAAEEIELVVERYFEDWEGLSYSVQEKMKDAWYGIVLTAIEDAQEDTDELDN